MSTLLNSYQLELELDDVRLRLPWGGRSPRGLTRAHELFIFKAQAEKSTSAIVDPAQGDLFETVARPGVWGGSPSLLPLPEVSDYGSRKKR